MDLDQGPHIQCQKLEKPYEKLSVKKLLAFFFSFIHAATAAFISFGHFSKLNPFLYCRGNLNTKLAFHDIAGFEQRAETAQSGTHTFREMIRSCIIHACSPTHLNPLAPSIFHFFKLSFQAKNNEVITYSGILLPKPGWPQLIVTQDDITLRC